MKDIKLKPCPFCGGKASVIETYCKDTDFRGYFVHHACRNFFETLRTSSYDKEEDAINVWNERCEYGD